MIRIKLSTGVFTVFSNNSRRLLYLSRQAPESRLAKVVRLTGGWLDCAAGGSQTPVCHNRGLPLSFVLPVIPNNVEN
jgi:hypothetical protein